MKFEALEKWLNDWKESKVLYLDRLTEALKQWSAAHCTAYNNHQVRKTIEVKDWSATKGYHTKTVKAVPVLIGNKEYLEYGYAGVGRLAYLKDCGFGDISQEDEKLAKYYSREERIRRVEKDVEDKRKRVIAKVQKICTDEVVEVAEVAGDGLFIRGANGKVAHMWAIFAGGYNIQCLHIRVLVKEAKWLEK